MKHIICLGYAKCGTTMLDAVFRKSRLVATPRDRKEIKFFLPAQFPAAQARAKYLEAFFEGGDEGVAEYTFEASPPYCHQPEEEFRAVLERIKGTLPEVQVVICVRHPVVRAYSHYIHNLHNFGLYGEGVFSSARMDLPRKVPRRTFEESLRNTGRLMTSYHAYLSAAYEVLGVERVSLFFLESDTIAFRPWVARLAGEAVAADLDLGAGETPGLVIPRRPVPNYVARGSTLFAFGSRRGELSEYADLGADELAHVFESRERWTLDLSQPQMLALTQEHFESDLRDCARLTGDARFLGYVDAVPEAQTAKLADERLLKTLHGVDV